jgi:hypothetical protein
MSDTGSHGPVRRSRVLGALGAGSLVAALGVVLVVGASTPASTATTKAPSKLAKAVAIATESVSQVVTLHDMAVGLGKPNGVPPIAVRATAQGLVAPLQSEAASARALGAPAKSPTAVLAACFAGYSVFAGEVAMAKNAVPPGFSEKLAAEDARWRRALADLDNAGHVDLLKQVPALLYPNGDAGVPK